MSEVQRRERKGKECLGDTCLRRFLVCSNVLTGPSLADSKSDRSASSISLHETPVRGRHCSSSNSSSNAGYITAEGLLYEWFRNMSLNVGVYSFRSDLVRGRGALLSARMNLPSSSTLFYVPMLQSRHKIGYNAGGQYSESASYGHPRLTVNPASDSSELAHVLPSLAGSFTRVVHQEESVSTCCLTARIGYCRQRYV